MSIIHFVYFQCKNSLCNLRFPAQAGSLPKERCPKCGTQLKKVESIDIHQEDQIRAVSDYGLYIDAILDNIRSTWNVGSMFRTADGFGLQYLYLCGITPTPSHPRVARTALGAEKTIAWQYHPNALNIAESLKSSGRSIWVLENNPEAINIFDLVFQEIPQSITLVLGNEICGVDPAILKMADRMISIPMVGLKRSYNVAVAFGIAISYLRYCHIFSQGSVRKLPNT